MVGNEKRARGFGTELRQPCLRRDHNVTLSLTFCSDFILLNSDPSPILSNVSSCGRRLDSLSGRI
jgi:hypothetical protein